MSAYEGQEPDEFEIVWRAGRVERVKAHQVSWTGGDAFGFSRECRQPERVSFHAEVDGRWKLMLQTLTEDIASIRNLTEVGDELWPQ